MFQPLTFTDYEVIYYLGQEDSYATIDKINSNMKVNLKLAHYSTQIPLLEGIMIISSSGRVYNQGFVSEALSPQRIMAQPWYEDILEKKGQLVVTPAIAQKYTAQNGTQSLFITGRSLTDPNGRNAGVILFLLSPDSIVSTEGLYNENDQLEQTRVILLTSENQLIYDSQERGLVHTHFDELDFNENHYFIHSNEFQPTGIKVIVAASKASLYENIRLYRNLAYTTVGIMFLAIIVISILLSYRIMKPLNRLVRSMVYVDNGFYQPIRVNSQVVEIEKLTQTYNAMILKIKHLFEDVYKAELKQNEAKFLALQNQINPHWLYNTLESIRMKAELSGSPQVAAMIKTLGRLFHMALSKKTKPNTIEDEIVYVKNYLELQNVRYEDRFHLVNELPAEILELPIIRLVLQPIVENSIIHGFLDHEVHYHIYIRHDIEQDHLIISVLDDGEGMSPDRLKKIRSILKTAGNQEQDSYHSIGLLNIQERLVLNYGQDFGLTIHSEPEKGTEVRITIPYKEAHHVQSDAS